jgi:hypothetical protein
MQHAYPFVRAHTQAIGWSVRAPIESEKGADKYAEALSLSPRFRTLAGRHPVGELSEIHLTLERLPKRFGVLLQESELLLEEGI